MNDYSKSERFKVIQQMLFEMAFGPTSFRINIVHNDAIASLECRLNEWAQLLQEMNDTNPQECLIFAPHNSSTHLILLNNEGKITAFSYRVPDLLNYTETALLGLPFLLVLSTNALIAWQELLTHTATSTHQDAAAILVFKTLDHHYFSAFCRVLILPQLNYVALCIFSESKDPTTPPSYPLPENMVLYASDVKGIYEVRDFILTHLDAPLPLIPQLARTFYIEQHKLKSGFRFYFQSSVHHFYQDARLKKAHLLLEQSTSTLADVAFQCGFNSYYSFYRAFKTKFGYTPTQVKRSSIT